MSNTPKISAFWLIVVAVPTFLLGALLFRGCQKKPVEVIRYLPVNLDSLKATIPPDTIEVPGRQITRIVRVPVLLSDTALVDSLRIAYEGQRDYYESLLGVLQQRYWGFEQGTNKALLEALRQDEQDWGFEWGTVELNTRETFYSDSVTTPDYFHRWNITAEGPITRYTYHVVPICQPCPVPAILKKKDHHLLLGVGGQFASGLIRPIYLGGYGYKFLRFQAGYIAPAQTEKSAFQLQIGVDWPIR